LAKLRAKKQKPGHSPKTASAFWQNLEPKNKNLVTTPKLISDFGETLEPKTKS